MVTSNGSHRQPAIWMPLNQFWVTPDNFGARTNDFPVPLSHFWVPSGHLVSDKLFSAYSMKAFEHKLFWQNLKSQISNSK